MPSLPPSGSLFVPWKRQANPAPAPGSAREATGAAAPAASPAPTPLAELLRRLAGGEAAALDELYRRESGPVYRYALALCGNAAWAADATHDAFMALIHRPEGYDPTRATLGAYLAGVARHALSAQWRELQRLLPLPEEDGGIDVLPAVAQAVSPDILLVRAQDSAAVWAALRRLATHYREAVLLVDVQERPYEEAAQIAGIPLNTLRTRLHRARLQLAALLGAPAAETVAATPTPTEVAR